MPGLNQSLSEYLNSIKSVHNFNHIEIGPLSSPLTIEFYEKWIANNFYGEMTYLKNHLELKKNPHLIDSQLKSVISISQNYFPAVEKSPTQPPARVALYAHNVDYHHWLKNKLLNLISDLKAIYPNEIFLPFVDSGPILERGIAYQNGLGWFGKNTCIINPEHGSLFFIAEILTSIAPQVSTETLEPLPDFCGKCQKCIEICPTQALTSPRLLEAEKCISYLTIESKKTPPLELRSKIGDWFFGCDLCQTVCPWNQKVFRKKPDVNTRDISTEKILELDTLQKDELINYFRFLLTASHKQIQKKHHGSPLLRAGAKGLKRNALIVIANRKLTDLRSEVQQLTNPDLHELAQWTLEQLNS